jgi:hypothetical protein
MLIIGIPALLVREYFKGRERANNGDSTYGWITDVRRTRSAWVYEYGFVCNGDTVVGVMNAGIQLKGCQFGYRECIGRRFKVYYAKEDCSNSKIDFDDEQK